MFTSTFVALLVAGVAVGQQFTCPDDGFYPDPTQCDKYYDCYRGEITPKLCPDGLVFDSGLGPRVEQCNYPFIVPCPDNAFLQDPNPSGIECPRQNGYFEHEDPSNCQQYYECTHGVSAIRTCHDGLVFDEITGTCQWEHTGLRSGCGIRIEVLPDGFSCPNITQLAENGHTLVHTRHLKKEDCRYFYVCFDGKHPQEVGCPERTVFNDATLNCDAPENVPGCENYYGDLGPV